MHKRNNSHRDGLFQDGGTGPLRGHQGPKPSDANIEPSPKDWESLAAMVLKLLNDIFEGVRRLDPIDLSIVTQPRAIRLPEVLEILGISKSALYEWLNTDSLSYDPALPRPFKLGKHDRSPSVWWHHEVVAYLKSHADQQRSS